MSPVAADAASDFALEPPPPLDLEEDEPPQPPSASTSTTMSVTALLAMAPWWAARPDNLLNARPLAEHSGVAQRVAAGLRIHAQPMGPGANPDPGDQPPSPRADPVHLEVVAAGQPQNATVGGYAAHVRTAAARQAPLPDRVSRPERDH